MISLSTRIYDLVLALSPSTKIRPVLVYVTLSFFFSVTDIVYENPHFRCGWNERVEDTVRQDDEAKSLTSMGRSRVHPNVQMHAPLAQTQTT